MCYRAVGYLRRNDVRRSAADGNGRHAMPMEGVGTNAVAVDADGTSS